MQRLSASYPIEWGVLIDLDRQDSLFPDAATLRAFASAAGLRRAAHLCGALAERIVTAPDEVSFNAAGFQRVQINHGRNGSAEQQIRQAARFGRRLGMRTVLQCIGDFPADPRVDWLYDVSFGTGARPASMPRLEGEASFVGYAGGITPDNVHAVLRSIDAPPDALYWIDMETGIRTNGWLDLDKCEAICRAVYG
jgi:hypothetical protein